jgi:hypothetical protein
MGKYNERAKALNAAGKRPEIGVDLGHPVMNLHHEPMDIDNAAGRRVRFTGEGGYMDELGSYRSILSVGAIYTVAAVEQGNWAAFATLEEFPGRKFDAVVFEDVAPEIPAPNAKTTTGPWSLFTRRF